MGLTLPFQLVILLVYGTIYMVDPDFRESEKIRIATEKARMEEARRKATIDARLFQESAITESALVDFENGKNLTKNCFNESFYCAKNKKILNDLESESRSNRNKSKFLYDFSKALKAKNEKIFYGCYCRKNIEPKVFENCPVDDLDQFCKNNHECYNELMYEYKNSESCKNKFITFLNKMNLDKDYSGYTLDEGIKIQKMRAIYSSVIFNDLLSKMKESHESK
ncbi:hypothetical protein [Leptospira sp. GIMC2001]|uniref:hypothetical protein n=1 Tax=Leptospira sp. GIMC2001 TaxID=1513297 RepID=UPI00234A46E8|nr:hypothetical protein [Leptospira sp. GIMC2001]WCL49968.1 hypothetical protein O4O04_03880 [Leptospira sp. GIMC2001]